MRYVIEWLRSSERISKTMWNREEKLARLAFGDVPTEEAARLEQEVRRDPKNAQILDEYMEMRCALRSLAEIPDDQLSKERLREAILGQGLRPAPVVSRGSWAWGPVLACLMGVAFMGARGHFMAKREPVVSIPDSVSILKPSEKVAIHFKARLPLAQAPLEAATNPVAALPPMSPISSRMIAESSESREGRRPLRRHRRSVVDQNVVSARLALYAPTSIPGIMAPTTADRPVDATANNHPVAMNEAPAPKPDAGTNGPIVLIDGEKDPNSGAQKAVEVESASNVVIGG